MSSVNEAVANYLAAWNETDPAKRRGAITQAWAEDGSYLDARREGSGHAAIDAMIEAAQARFTGYRSRLASGIEARLDRVRFSWAAGGTPEAPLFFAGTGFATLSADGRFKAVTGFTDARPVVG